MHLLLELLTEFHDHWLGKAVILGLLLFIILRIVG